MNVIFEKVKLHNFLSYGDAEVELSNKGYCIIRGVNNDKRDDARSNGSGKSSLVSAISWSLTGETIQGKKNNIPNTVFDDGCWVELTMKVDGNSYVITRYKDDPKMKTDLKIIVNGEDKSGKGIKESQENLENLLPDLDSKLLRSVIILGQGMPGRFSDNTPSGRKNLLESLSKSDFMITDIKTRIENRITELNNQDNDLNVKLVTEQTKLDMNNRNLVSAKDELAKLSVSRDYDKELKDLNISLTARNQTLETDKTELSNATIARDGFADNILSYTKTKQEEIDRIKNTDGELINKKSIEKVDIQNKIENIKNEITRLENIKDVCPTCGQKIPGVTKVDTTKQHKDLDGLNTIYNKLQEELKTLNADSNLKLNEVENKYEKLIREVEGKKSEMLESIKKIEKCIKDDENEVKTLQEQINKLTVERDTHINQLNTVKKTIAALEFDIKTSGELIESIIKDKTTLKEHIDVIDKMNSLVKRDFRGYLLKNVISFISKKSKEYAKQVFGSDNLEFKLDGNDIDISYCGKDFDNLSGGEKQKVDIILQLSLREMMTKYLNFRCNCLFIDEGLDFLDARGSDKIIELLSYVTKDIESLFFISHRVDELSVPCDSVLEVIKDSRGVSKVYAK